MFRMLDFIEEKRDRIKHSPEALHDFVVAVRDDSVPDYQLAAWLMATYLNGLDDDELRAFTKSLAESGDIIKLPGGATAVDKHSTGGVGDKTTLIVAPLVAACGLPVAKLSGRGLGFTGGTVDKLESIPGMEMHLSTAQFVAQIERIGIAISGHSLALAPAEGKFYAMRDVTGTVPSLPLIASSIVSKKIAGGADAFVFDVKCGSGAFMQTPDDAQALASALVSLSASCGKNAVCLISDMEQPLGEWVGNAAEVREAIDVLSGRGPADTRALSLALAVEMLHIGGVTADREEAARLATRKLDDGEALKKLRQVVEAQGGDAGIYDTPEKLPQAAFTNILRAPKDGFVASADARTTGSAIRALGGGRMRKDTALDMSVAIRLLRKTGDRVAQGEPVAEIHYNTQAQLDAAGPYLESLFTYADTACPRPLILARVAASRQVE